MTTVIHGFDLDECCTSARFDSGQLYLTVSDAESGKMGLVMLAPSDAEYLSAMKWAILSNQIPD